MIGLIGLGNMGLPIARRLLAEHGALVVFDRDPLAMAPLAEAGAVAANSARDVADQAGIVLACLPDAAASIATAEAVKQGMAVEIYADLSTIGIEAMHDIAALFAGGGTELVDAPVSGGAQGARDGTLSIMLAGRAQACGRLEQEVCASLGKVLIVGTEPGQAQLCKLVNNALSFTALAVSSEAVAVGAKAGIDPRVLLDVVAAGTGRNSAVADKLPRAVLTRRFDLGAQLGAALKDLQLFLDEASAAGQTPGVIAETDAQWRAAVARFGGDCDASYVARYFEDRVGVTLEPRQRESVR